MTTKRQYHKDFATAILFGMVCFTGSIALHQIGVWLGLPVETWQEFFRFTIPATPVAAASFMAGRLL